jgi:hypothetical protein
MEATAPIQKQSTASKPRLFIWMVLFVQAVVIAGMIAARREVSNPFSAYRDLFGDDARQAALARGFKCQNSKVPDASLKLADLCVQHDPDKMFSRLSLRMSGDIVNEIIFSPGENRLTLGDLGALWGKPEIAHYCEVIAASWPDRQIMGLISPSGRIGYFSPVISVSFMRGGPSGWRRMLMNDALHNCGGAAGV